MHTYDSLHYIVTASNLVENSKLISLHNQPLTAFPPLYPILIALCFYVHKSLSSLLFLHVFIYIVNVLLLLQFFKSVADIYVRTLAFIFTFLSSFFIINHIFIWSEAFFYTLSFLWFWQTLRLNKNQSVLNASLYILIGLLMCMQRKTGFIFILSSAIFYLIQSKNWNFKQFLFVGFITFLASLFTIYWRIRSTILDQNFMYDKHFSLAQTWKAINEEITELGTWLIPRIAPESLKWIIILLLIVFIFKQFSNVKVNKPIQLSITLLIVYSGVIISFMTFYKLSQTMDIRVMGSISPFIILIVAKAVENYKNTNQSKYQNIILISIFSIVMCYNLARSYTNLEQWKSVKKMTLKEILAQN